MIYETYVPSDGRHSNSMRLAATPRLLGYSSAPTHTQIITFTWKSIDSFVVYTLAVLFLTLMLRNIIKKLGYQCFPFNINVYHDNRVNKGDSSRYQRVVKSVGVQVWWGRRGRGGYWSLSLKTKHYPPPPTHPPTAILQVGELIDVPSANKTASIYIYILCL